MHTDQFTKSNSARKEIIRAGVIKYFLALSLFILPLLIAPFLYVFIQAFPLISSLGKPNEQLSSLPNPDVLAETDATDSARIQFNIDTVFNDNVYVDGELLVKGRTIFSGAVEAPNIIYEVNAGPGLELTGDQNITLVNTGVISIQGQTGEVLFEEGTGIDIEGTTITNTGVTSLNGSTGAVSFEGGTGISIDGTTISLSTPPTTNSFASIDVPGQDSIIAGREDSLTFVAGSGIALSTNSSSKELTISALGGASGWTDAGDVVYTTNILDRVGIGTVAPVSLFSVGTTSGFQVNAAGAVVAASGLTSSGDIQFLNLTNGLLVADANGVLSVATAGIDYENPLTFGNGLTRTGNTIDLGSLTGNWTQANAFDIVLANADAQIQIMEATGNQFFGTIDVGDLSGDQIYTFPDESGEICLSTGNCVGSGGLGGSGDDGRMARFNGSFNLESGSINDLYQGGVGVTIDADGDVGIGTETPDYALDVAGDIKVGDGSVLLLGQSAVDPGTAADGSLYYNIVDDRFRCREGGTWKYCDTSISGGSISGTGTAGQLSFFSSPTTIAGSTNLVWNNASGYFGIGSPTPNAALSIGSTNQFQVTSTGGIAAATGITSSGTITFSALGNGIVKSTGGTLSVGTVDLQSEVNGTLPVSNGGTGATSFTSNGVLTGNGSGALSSTTAPTSGQVLVGNASGIPAFVTISGDATVSNTGALTLSNTGATSGTYGSATEVPQFNVDSKGRITSIGTVAISAIPGGGTVNDYLRGDSSWAPLDTTAVVEGSNLYFTAERTDDRVAALIQNGTGLAWTYNDGANTLTGNVSLASFTTDNLAEGSTNLYFTTARSRAAISATSPISYNASTGVLSCPTCVTTSSGGYVTSLNGLGGDVTITGTANKITVTENANDITLSLPQNIATTSSPTFSGITLSGLASPTGNELLTVNTSGVVSRVADGNPGQVLVTDGDGNLSWASGATGTVTEINTTGPLTGGPITSTGTIGITQATTSTDGYLSSADWNTFNTKQNALTFGNLTSSTTGVTVTGGTGAVIGAGTSISIQNASSSQPGLLTAADWTTFNNKQNALPVGTSAQYIRGDQTLATLNTSVVPESGNLYFTNERSDDRTAALIQDGIGLNWTYDDALNTLTGDVTLAAFTTDDLAEGASNLYWTQTRFNTAFNAKDTDDLDEGTTNLYFTNARARAALSGVSPIAFDTSTGEISCPTCVTTSSGGYITSINGLTDADQTFALGTSGTNVNISSVGSVHTFNFPTASSVNRGLLSSTDWTTFNNKQNALPSGTALQYIRGDQTLATLDTSVVPENGNLYWTTSRFNTAFATKDTDELDEGTTNLYFTN